MFHGIIIDPYAKTIEPIEMESVALKDIYDVVKCGTIDVVALPAFNGIPNVMYLDDEGLFKEGQAFFELRGYRQPLAGRALILGTSQEGDDTSTTIPIEVVRQFITWPEIAFAGMTETEVNPIEILGSPGVEIKTTPIFRPKRTN